MSLQCTNYKRFMSHDLGLKIKKPKSVTNLAQSKVFEPLMLET